MLDSPWRIRLLGDLNATQNGHVLTRFRTRKTAELFAYLAFSMPRALARDTLAGVVWPDASLEAGANNLRVALSSLRRQIEPPGVPQGAILIATRSSVQLNAVACVTDVAAFETALRTADVATTVPARVAALQTAVANYSGPLLPGYDAEWIEVERRRLATLHSHALQRLVVELMAAGQFPQAIPYAQQLVQADPLLEESYATLMQLYAACGRPGAALEVFRDLQRVLRDELDAEPHAALQRLAAELATAELATAELATANPPLATPAPVEPPVVPAAPPVPPAPLEPQESGNLPLQWTRFFGREAEIAQMDALLSDGATRIVTLTGPGGVGKTRLVVALAQRLRSERTQRVCFAALAEVTDGPQLVDALLDALRVVRSPGAQPFAQLVAALQERPTLLVLDNFEQLVSTGTPIVMALLGRVPTLRCLVTSRRVLALPGEQPFEVPPLLSADDRRVLERVAQHAVAADVGALAQITCVQLLVDRAQAVRPDFQITPRHAADLAQLSLLLEGLPLAIELAAARAHVLTPNQILTQLGKRFDVLRTQRGGIPPRQQSLWAAISWSYDLLPPAMQRLFVDLSVFRGSWTLDAATQVCAEPHALEYLTQLRVHSLVQVDGSVAELRFRLLETLREWGAEHCAPETAATLGHRHLHFYLAQAEERGPLLHGPDQGHQAGQLVADYDNLRAALHWSIREGHDPANGLRLAAALHPFWEMRGYLKEGRTWLTSALATTSAVAPDVQARALRAAGALARSQGEYRAAAAYFEQSLALAQQVDDQAGRAGALTNLGHLYHDQAQYDQARDCFQQALALHQTLGSTWGIASAYNNLGLIAECQGDLDRAAKLYADGVALLREVGDERNVANALLNLANIVREQGRYDEAAAMLDECRACYESQGDTWGIAYVVLNQGTLAEARGAWHDALACYDHSWQLCGGLGDRWAAAHARFGMARSVQRGGDWAQAAEWYRESLRIRHELGDQEGVALSLGGLADLAVVRGEWENGIRLWAVVHTLREALGAPLPPSEHAVYQQSLAVARRAVRSTTYDQAWQSGLALPAEQAVAEALNDRC